MPNLNVGPRWIPPHSCPCGERHRIGARYYVSVIEHQGGPYVLALGPFLTHEEALARVGLVSEYVHAHYNPNGRAAWYLYGTAAVPYADGERPGKLNEEITREHMESAPRCDDERSAREPARRTRKASAAHA